MKLLLLAALAVAGWFGFERVWSMMHIAPASRVITQRVTSGPLVVTVTEDGNVESAANVEVKCQVSGGSVILTIVPDGTMVKKGDLITELDSSTIEEQISQQKIVYEKAVAARIQVEKEFSAAKIAVQEYIEGTYLKELQLLEAQVKIAEENMRSAQNSLQHTERLARKGYVTTLQLEAQQFAVQRSKLDLDAAKTAKNVLEKFTRPKMLEDLESKRDSAEARMRSEQAACDLEKQRLDRLETQLVQCKVYAPQDGMVIYANEQSSRMSSSSSSVKIEEGAAIRERQAIVRLPDLSQMQVKVLVHESKIEQVRVNQPAQIRWLDKSFTGRVTFIANQPEPTSFFSGNVKEYAAFVRIDGEVHDLRPGMTAEVEILISSRDQVLTVPVQAVVEQAGKTFAWVRRGEEFERRPVVLGLSSNERIEIKDGLTVDDEVVLNPRAVIAAAREETVAPQETVDVAKKFGATQTPEPSAAAPDKGPPPGKGSRPALQFSELDKNGDKKITADEVQSNERLSQAFGMIDANQDGGITASEWSAFRAKMEAMKKQAAPPGT